MIKLNFLVALVNIFLVNIGVHKKKEEKNFRKSSLTEGRGGGGG